MAEATPIQTNFTAGELSPLLDGREDFAKFFNGARLIENLMCTVLGPLIRRPGTMFTASCKFADKLARPLPFEFNVEQAYNLECGENYFRFYRDRGRIEVVATGSTIANGTFDSDIASWTDASGAGSDIVHDGAGNRMQFNSDGATEAVARQTLTIAGGDQAKLHVICFDVGDFAHDTMILRIGTTSAGTEILEETVSAGHHCREFTPGVASVFLEFATTQGASKPIYLDNVAFLSNGPVEIVSPYLEADLRSIKHNQSADVLYLMSPNYFGRKLFRKGHSSWSIVLINFKDGPYLAENTTPTTLDLGANTGFNVTLVASSKENINGGEGFKATDVGRLVRVKHTDWGYCRIVSFTDDLNVNVDILSDFDANTPSATWRLGLYSDTDGHPTCAVFHRGRFWSGGPGALPGRVDGTRTFDFENYTPGALDDDPISAVADSDVVPNILWMLSERELIAGAAGGEVTFGGETPKTAQTPSNVSGEYATAFGVADIQPVRAPTATLFMQRHGRKLLELAFRITDDNFRGADMNQLAPQATKTKIVDLAYQKEPNSIVWCARTDGQLVGFTYQRDQEVTGWHRHPIGGAGAAVEGVSSIPGTEGDELWLTVRRSVNGATVRYMEYLGDALELGDPQENAFYVDSGLSRNGAPATAISGLDHLEGETVRVLVDGASHPDLVVSGGAVTLDAAASVVHAGLPVVWKLSPQRPNIRLASGSSQGQPKRITHLILRVLDTLGISAGPTEEKLTPLSIHSGDQIMGEAPALENGDLRIPLPGGWEDKDAFLIVGDNALPATIICVVSEMEA